MILFPVDTISSMNIQPDPDENDDFPTGPLPDGIVKDLELTNLQKGITIDTLFFKALNE